MPFVFTTLCGMVAVAAWVEGLGHRYKEQQLFQ